jgi:hypothetical protein
LIREQLKGAASDPQQTSTVAICHKVRNPAKGAYGEYNGLAARLLEGPSEAGSPAATACPVQRNVSP